MDKISFCLMQIIIESSNPGERFLLPEKQLFDKLPSKDTYSFEGTYYEIAVINTAEYVWLSFNYGRPNPRDEKVTNIDTNIKRDNDRKDNEAELVNQLFVLIDSKETIYVSDSRKKKLLESYFKLKLETNLTIKTFYKNEKELLQIIKQVDKIQFTHASNLFNVDSNRKKALVDLTGMDAPEKFTIEAEYKKNDGLTGFIKDLFMAKEKYEISDLVICGRNEENISFLYNNDTFSKKIDISCKKGSNGKFDEERVLSELIKINLL